jgi:hypothetical protein
METTASALGRRVDTMHILNVIGNYCYVGYIKDTELNRSQA